MKPKTIEIRCDLASAVRAAKQGMDVRITNGPPVAWRHSPGRLVYRYNDDEYVSVAISDWILAFDAFTVVAPVDPKCVKCHRNEIAEGLCFTPVCKRHPQSFRLIGTPQDYFRALPNRPKRRAKKGGGK